MDLRKRHRRDFAKSEFSPVFRHFVNVLINRVVVDNLPEEIDEKFLLYHVLLFGRILIFKKNGKFHTMWFSGKGKMNEYYIQKEFLIVNPWATETSGDYDEKNAGILYSDINAYIENADVGLYDLVKDYSEIINSIDTSIRALSKNSKVIAFLTGSTQSFVSSAKQMINTLLNSDDCIGVMEESFLDSIKVNPISEKMDYKFSELIKARQYYISDFYQKIGISANMNMKAERLTDNESQLIDSCAEVDFEHIIDNLNFSVAKINDLFGLNISFRLNEDEVVNNYDKGDETDGEENGTGTGTVSDTGNGVQGTETPQLESGVSGVKNVSSGDINGEPSAENNAVGKNSDEQGTNPEISDENSEVEVNVNIEVNAETAETEVVDNSDDTKDSENETTEEKEDEKKEVE
jgi:hypothetical protein